jgi:hypothetical protein
MKKNTKNTGVKLDLTKKEAEYLSSLVEAQVSRLIMRKQNVNKEEYRVFNKLGEMLAA